MWHCLKDLADFPYVLPPFLPLPPGQHLFLSCFSGPKKCPEAGRGLPKVLSNSCVCVFFFERSERNSFPFHQSPPLRQTLPHTLSVCSNSSQLGALGAGFCPLWDKSEKHPVSGQGWKKFQPQKSPSPARRKEKGHCLKIHLWVPTPRVLVPLPLFYWDPCWKPNNPQVPQP